MKIADLPCGVQQLAKYRWLQDHGSRDWFQRECHGEFPEWATVFDFNWHTTPEGKAYWLSVVAESLDYTFYGCKVTNIKWKQNPS